MMRTLLAVALFAFLSACTSPGEVQGSVDGNTLEVASAIFQPLGRDSKIIGIMLTDRADACERSNAHIHDKDGVQIGLFLARHDGTPQNLLPIVAGEYPIVPIDEITSNTGHPPALASAGGFVKNDSECRAAIASEKMAFRSGVVRIDQLSAEDEVEGSFDVTVGDQGDKLTGRFVAAFCRDTNSTAAITCK